jgi:hypothetical protein
MNHQAMLKLKMLMFCLRPGALASLKLALEKGNLNGTKYSTVDIKRMEDEGQLHRSQVLCTNLGSARDCRPRTHGPHAHHTPSNSHCACGYSCNVLLVIFDMELTANGRRSSLGIRMHRMCSRPGSSSGRKTLRCGGR